MAPIFDYTPPVDPTHLYKFPAFALNDEDTENTSGDEAKLGIPIPDELSGWVIIDYVVTTHTLGEDDNCTFNLVKRSSGVEVDVLSSPVTLTDVDYFANNGTINPANQEINLGDMLYPKCTGHHTTTKSKGASVVIVCKPPA